MEFTRRHGAFVYARARMCVSVGAGVQTVDETSQSVSLHAW